MTLEGPEGRGGHGPVPVPSAEHASPLPATLRRAIAQSEAHVRGLADLLAQRRAQGWSAAELEGWLRAAREHLDELREMRDRRSPRP